VGLLVGEALVISLVGGMGGMVMAMLVCDTLRNGAGYVADFSQLIVAPSVFAIGLGISLVIGFISSLIPAYTASRRPILDALRVND
jgi:ABC-type antimicrobial peptide transport system permease subunit